MGWWTPIARREYPLYKAKGGRGCWRWPQSVWNRCFPRWGMRLCGRGSSHTELGIGLQAQVKKRSRTVWVLENEEGENRKSSYTSGESGKGMSRWETGRRTWDIGNCSLIRRMSLWCVSWSQQEQQSQMGWKALFRMVTTCIDGLKPGLEEKEMQILDPLQLSENVGSAMPVYWSEHVF